MQPETEPEAPSSSFSHERAGWRHHRGKLLVSLLIGACFVWLLHAGALPLWPPADALAGVKWWAVGLYVPIWCVIHVLRAARWHLLIAPLGAVPFRRVLAIGFLGLAAILMFPLRTGEFVRPLLLHRASRISGWAATGTIAAERIIDGLTLSAILFFSLELTRPLDPLPDRIGDLPIAPAIVPAAAYSALSLFALAFAVMGVFYWRRALARRVTELVIGVVSLRFAHWLARRVEQVADGLRFLPRFRYSGPFLLMTLGYWLGNAGANWLLAWACGFEDMSYGESCAIMGVLALGILLPSAPGFFGAFQVSTYAGLALYFAPERVVHAGAAYVLVIYSIQVTLVLLAGVVGALLEHAARLAEV